MKGRNKATLIVVSLILIAPCFTGAKANTTKNHNPILFLHGGFCTHRDWDIMSAWFEADGWPETALYAYTFAENDDCTFEVNINNANEIKQWVDEILKETGADKIDFVAHSMGGMSSRYYIKILGGIDTVDDYVSLGSPHHGNTLTYCGPRGVDDVALLLNEGDETPGGILNDTVGIRVDPVHGHIYNSTHIPGNITYTSIYSRDDEVVQYDSSPLDGAHNILIEDLSHSQLYQEESVYDLVKAAVDDTLPNGSSTQTTSWDVLFLLLSLFVMLPLRQRKKKS